MSDVGGEQVQAEPVQVREGRWRTRDRQTWGEDGRYHVRGESPSDLVEYLGPIESQPQPEPVQVPVQVCEGRWRTRGGKIRDVIPTPDDDERAKKYPWYDAKYDQTWQNNGRYYLDEENQRDLVEYLGPIEPDKTQEPPDKTQELQAEYTPPAGWRVLAVGEVLQGGDVWVNHEGESRPTKRVGERVNDERYIRVIELQPQPNPQPEPEKLPEGCRNDGGWSSVNGIEPEPWPEPQPEPQPQPVPQPVPQDADQMIRLLSEANHNHVAMIGRLQAAINERAELGGADQTRAELQARIRGLEIMTDTQAETIARLQSEAHELNMEIGGLQGDLSRRQARIRDLETMHAAATQAVVDAGKENDKLRAQADDFRSEIHYVQKELGEARAELAGAIQSRDALAAVNREIRRNETLREQLDAAAAELQKRNPDHVGRAISTEEWMDQFARDASVSRLQADRNDLAGKVVSLREQLQLANDRLAQLEVLQPIAAACHTAQTMVRDMLGHMRCLLALQHTTDRRDSCTLLESILEVFDDAECNEDEDEDDDTTCTTNTSEAGQG